MENNVNILVLCTGNSCRSQMAEGYLRNFLGGTAIVYSAGIESHGVNPKAIQAMKDDGIDISHHTSNNISEYSHLSFDYVITVCDNAKENCPYFPSVKRNIHKNFPDPAKYSGTDAETYSEFLRVRNLIRGWCHEFSESMKNISAKH